MVAASGSAFDEPARDVGAPPPREEPPDAGAAVAAERLASLAQAFGLDDAGTAGLLRVELTELDRWRRSGVPRQYRAEVEALTALAERLLATFRPETVPRVMRAPVPGGSGWSALDAIRAGHYEAVVNLMAPVGDYVMDADPDGVHQQRAEAARRTVEQALSKPE